MSSSESRNADLGRPALAHTRRTEKVQIERQIRRLGEATESAAQMVANGDGLQGAGFSAKSMAKRGVAYAFGTLNNFSSAHRPSRVGGIRARRTGHPLAAFAQ